MRIPRISLEFGKLPEHLVSPFTPSVLRVWSSRRLEPIPQNARERVAYKTLLFQYCLENGLDPLKAPPDAFKNREALTADVFFGGDPDKTYMLGESTVNARMVGAPVNIQDHIDPAVWMVNGMWEMRFSAHPQVKDSFIFVFPGGLEQRGVAYQINKNARTLNMGFGKSEFLHIAMQMLQDYLPSMTLRPWTRFLPEDTTHYNRRLLESALGIEKKHMGPNGIYWGLGYRGETFAGIGAADTEKMNRVKRALSIVDDVVALADTLEQDDD